jgi:hypothetical protein
MPSSEFDRHKMLPCLACLNFNGLGNPYRGFCNFCDSGCDEPAEPVVVRRCHSAGNTRSCLNKLCLIHSEISDVVCELNVNRPKMDIMDRMSG